MICFFLFMIHRPPRSTLTDTLFPYPTLFRSQHDHLVVAVGLLEGALQNLDRVDFVAREELLEGADNPCGRFDQPLAVGVVRSEEHTSELQSLMRISYAVLRLKKNKTTTYSPKQIISNTQL